MPLAHLGPFHVVNLIVAKHVVQRKGEGALQGSARAHACAQGHVAGKSRVEALDGNAQRHHLATNAVDVAGPSGLWSLLVVERELYLVLQVDAVGTHVAGAVGLQFGNHSLFNGAWEYVAIVIVGMFADEVDTAGSGVNISSGAVEVLDEAAPYIFDC